ncbi:MAG: hypothetical protein ACREA0_14080 [bacterium]
MNETLQWAAIVVLALLLVGTLRQVALLMPPEMRGPPTSGPRVGARLPRRTWSRIRESVPLDIEQELSIAFVTEACALCRRLLAGLPDPDLQPADLVLVAHHPSDEFLGALTALPYAVLSDDGSIWEECNVTSTPLVLQISGDGRVQSKEVTHRVQPAHASTR